MASLKKQGYNFEHNYGHGKENLCSVMTMLMMLAFLIDQVQQLCSSAYQKAHKHAGALKVLFERVRTLIHMGGCRLGDAVHLHRQPRPKSAAFERLDVSIEITGMH